LSGVSERRSAPPHFCASTGGRYRFEALGSDFTAEIALDGDGLVVEYPRLARRVWSR